jgi:hypothetical protein
MTKKSQKEIVVFSFLWKKFAKKEEISGYRVMTFAVHEKKPKALIGRRGKYYDIISLLPRILLLPRKQASSSSRHLSHTAISPAMYIASASSSHAIINNYLSCSLLSHLICQVY